MKFIAHKSQRSFAIKKLRSNPNLVKWSKFLPSLPPPPTISSWVVKINKKELSFHFPFLLFSQIVVTFVYMFTENSIFVVISIHKIKFLMMNVRFCQAKVNKAHFFPNISYQGRSQTFKVWCLIYYLNTNTKF
jgi:hypothetical protein